MVAMIGCIYHIGIVQLIEVSQIIVHLQRIYPVKPTLETTCIKQSTALRDHSSDTTPLLKSTY